MSKEEKTEFFVSRRGKQVGVHEVDLSDINVEDDRTQKPPQQTKQSTAAKTDKKLRHTKLNSTVQTPSSRMSRFGSKRRLYIAAMIVGIVAIPVISAELVGAEYRRGEADAHRQLEQIINERVLPAQKQPSISAESVRSMADQVKAVSTKMCRGGLLDNIADLYPRAKRSHAECNDMKQNYAALSSRTYTLADQAAYLEKLGSAMTPVSEPVSEGYAAVGAQLALWNKAADTVKALSPPASLTAAHASLLTSVTDTRDTWSRLNTANNSQDASAFTAAEQELGKQYEAVRTSSVAFSQAVSRTQADITLAYQNIQ